MPGQVVQRWVIGRGGFIGEVSLFELSQNDAHVRGRDRRVYVELSNLHIHPLRRGRGWSHVLLRAALAHAAARGWCVFLRTVPYNKPTMNEELLRKLYRGYGFKSLRGDPREMVLRWPQK